MGRAAGTSARRERGPTAEHTGEDAQYGQVRVRAWAGLHAIPQNHPTKGTRGPKPIVRGTLVLVEVDRLPRGGHKRQALWLWWRGPGAPDLAMLWRTGASCWSTSAICLAMPLMRCSST